MRTSGLIPDVMDLLSVFSLFMRYRAVSTQYLVLFRVKKQNNSCDFNIKAVGFDQTILLLRHELAPANFPVRASSVTARAFLGNTSIACLAFGEMHPGYSAFLRAKLVRHLYFGKAGRCIFSAPAQSCG